MQNMWSIIQAFTLRHVAAKLDNLIYIFNVLDDERVISREQGIALSKQFNCTFLETSAKFKINVSEVITSLIIVHRYLQSLKFFNFSFFLQGFQ